MRWAIAVALVVVAGGVVWLAARRPGPAVAPRVEEAAPALPPADAPRHEVASGRRSATSEQVARVNKVSVDNPFGSVEVVGEAGVLSVESRAYLPGRTPEEARRQELPIELRAEMTASHEYRVEVVPTKDTPLLDTVVMDLKVRVPSRVAVRVEVTTGKAIVSGITGGVEVHGQAGQVAIRRCTGKVSASTTVGDLEVAETSGEIEANTSSGALVVDRARGQVIARTMDGRVEVHVVRADKVIASSMSGPIEVRVASPFSGEMEVRSMSGDISVAIPPGSNCRVETMTNTGPISCTLPLWRVERAGPNVSGVLGAGRGKVLVTNNSGAISVAPLK